MGLFQIRAGSSAVELGTVAAEGANATHSVEVEFQDAGSRIYHNFQTTAVESVSLQVRRMECECDLWAFEECDPRNEREIARSYRRKCWQMKKSG